MKSQNIWHNIVALLFISFISLNVSAENDTYANQTSENNQQVQTEEEEPVEIDLTIEPFNLDWWMIMLGN